SFLNMRPERSSGRLSLPARNPPFAQRRIRTLPPTICIYLSRALVHNAAQIADSARFFSSWGVKDGKLLDRGRCSCLYGGAVRLESVCCLPGREQGKWCC